MFSIRSTIAGLAGTLLAMACGSALADAADHEAVLSRLAPHDRPAYVEQIIARQQAERSQSAAADVTPPVLTLFKAPTTFNVSQAAAPFKAAVKATDDLSGVRYIYFYAKGPSGQSIYAYVNAGYPTKSFSGNAGFSSISRMLEPGTWKFYYAYGYDVAGNYFQIDEAALAALGNTTFTVVNTSGHDLVAPQLTSGKILTPAVSLAAHAPGTTNQDVYVGVKVSATDAGNTAVAGIRQVVVYFCKLADLNKCIYLGGYLYATGVASATLSATTQVSVARGHVPGDYEMYYVYFYDHAGNYNGLTSTKFGGTTDFSTLFPTTVIKLNP